MNRILPALFVVLLGLGLAPQAQARTLDLAFLPPDIPRRNVCTPPLEDFFQDLQVGEEIDQLTNPIRIRYLNRDINRLQARDPVKWFNFINELITRLAQVDPDFGGVDELVARINLYIDAERLDQLRADGLVPRLRQREVEMDSNQRLILAQFYLNGIGVAVDREYAQKLILDAAFQGNANALLSIARFQLEGDPLPGWDAPLDLTVSMAFGGLLGTLNEFVCGRAERIALEYLNGEVVSRNEDVAMEWYKFSADMGGANGAWLIVQHHLNAPADRKDNEEMLRYLQLAVERGITIDYTEMERIKSASDVQEEELLQILGYNFSEDMNRTRRSISPYFRLVVNIDGDRLDEESLYMDYLREIAQLPSAPGWIHTELAKEVLIRKGRWAGEPDAIAYLEEAVARDDPEGMQLLAKLLTRYRDDPSQVQRVISLLTLAVERHGLADAMDDLDGLYRCKLNDAPRMREATAWARAYRASMDKTFSVTPGDLLVMDPYKDPRHVAIVQTQALMGRSTSTANYAQRVQADGMSTDSARRLWAERIDRSDQALEAFAELEFDLATNPTERDLAVELFRRIYLNNGVTTALDLAIALVEHDARDESIADEVIELLTMAGNRGEGAAIRLLARLQSREGRDQADVYRQFSQEIENRGDFLALMFAIPYIPRDRLDDYIDRAVSEMVCGTKDADELGDAYAIWGDQRLTFQWRVIGLQMDYGHTLSKLRLSDAQMDQWRRGDPPNARQVFDRLLSEGEANANRELYRLTADPDLETYDPQAAAGYLAALLERGAEDDESFVLANVRAATSELREAIGAMFDISTAYTRAIENGSPEAQFEYGMYLRKTATDPRDLADSASYLRQAAENGVVEAMVEYGYVLAYGIGIPQNMREAALWLERAERSGSDRAASLSSLIRLGAGQ